jgi:hypothetical protein
VGFASAPSHGEEDGADAEQRQRAWDGVVPAAGNSRLGAVAVTVVASVVSIWIGCRAQRAWPDGVPAAPNSTTPTSEPTQVPRRRNSVPPTTELGGG